MLVSFGSTSSVISECVLATVRAAGFGSAGFIVGQLRPKACAFSVLSTG